MRLPFDCVVIGAGAAGLLAASEASRRGKRTLLLEKNRKPGVKILMSGGTRCNLTQDTDTQGIISAFGKEGRFLHSALSVFSNDDLVRFFNQRGVPTKTEPTGKIFPQSDRAKDVLDALVQDALENDVKLNLAEPVIQIDQENARFRVQSEKAIYETPHVLITTGGKSFPGCGTTGDGYQWCKSFGHSIVSTYPALVPLKTPENGWARALQGVTLPHVRLSIVDSNETPLATATGSTLFTHLGVSGPAAMNISKAVTTYERGRQSTLSMQVDLLPQFNPSQKADEIEKLLRSHPKKQLGTILKNLLPVSVVEVVLANSELAGETRNAEVSKVKQRSLAAILHALTTPITGSLGFAKAEVTAGGVDLLEVNSSTMESKCQPGLFLAGEILNLDGPIGGYNFTAAFATGFLAGQNL